MKSHDHLYPTLEIMLVSATFSCLGTGGSIYRDIVLGLHHLVLSVPVSIPEMIILDYAGCGDSVQSVQYRFLAVIGGWEG